MHFDNGPLDATLASAAGEDPALLHELRQAFAESAAGHLDLLKRARCDGNWQMAAMRLKGLASSFHARQLMELAEDALTCAPGDPFVVRQIEAFVDDFTASNG